MIKALERSSPSRCRRSPAVLVERNTLPGQLLGERPLPHPDEHDALKLFGAKWDGKCRQRRGELLEWKMRKHVEERIGQSLLSRFDSACAISERGELSLLRNVDRPDAGCKVRRYLLVDVGFLGRRHFAVDLLALLCRA